MSPVYRFDEALGALLHMPLDVAALLLVEIVVLAFALLVAESTAKHLARRRAHRDDATQPDAPRTAASADSIP